MPLKRLSQIADGTDIHELQSCIYPGGHCPLFGAHLTLEPIAGVTMLVVGLADCGFYAYKTMKNFAAPCRRGARVLSCVLEEPDVIYGCADALKSILLQLDQDSETKMIVVITSCVIELIGEDVEGVVEEVKPQCRTPIAVIRTENFKTADYMEGVEKALAAVSHLLTAARPIPGSFSVLGPRFQGVRENSIIQRLMADGYTLTAEFPCNTDWEAIGRISTSSFVLVSDAAALNLARRLAQDFGIPFVDLSPNSSWAGITAAYGALSRVTGTPYAEVLDRAEENLRTLRTRLKRVFAGKRFIVGNGMGSPFAAAHLIAEIGGHIALILAGNIYEKDREPVRRLLALHQDPPVAKNANTAALEAHLDRLQADFHIGMGWGRRPNRPKPRLLPIGTLQPLMGLDYPQRFYASLMAHAEKEGIFSS